MPELETLIRAAAPRPGRAPAELEWRIWTALADAAPNDRPLLAEPELVVGEPVQHRAPERRPRVFLGVAAAAAILLAAVAVAGVRAHRGSRPAAGGRHTAPAVPREGQYYLDNSCPDANRGACFDPFPAGRYSFHKAYPQVTLAVPSGWRNDDTWPLEVVLSRPDTPGATLEILNDAHALRGSGCTVGADPGRHDAAHLLAPLTRVRGFATSAAVPARIGERAGSSVDLQASATTRGLNCPDGPTGTPLLASPPDASGNDGWVLTLRGGESARVTLANGTGGRTIALVAIVRGDAAALRAWLAKSRPVIDSITFAPCTFNHMFSQPCEDLGRSSP